MRRMMMRTDVRSLSLALTLVATLGTTHCLAGPNGVARPFKGDAQSLVTGVREDGSLVLESVGNATHLGKFTKTEFLYLNDMGAISGTAVFTAANGDQICAHFAGNFTSPTTAEGDYTITGGTGRFFGATGTIHFDASAKDLFSLITLKLTGTISY
jgi:hypothetical protein